MRRKPMTEISNGLWRAIKNSESVALALVFFIGHIIIAMIVVKLMTGASMWEAGAVAIVEPAVNSVWFYILHKVWYKISDYRKYRKKMKQLREEDPFIYK